MKIPKLLHQIWLGGAIPKPEADYVQTWIRYFPDWEHRIWCEDNIADWMFPNRAAYDDAHNYAEKSDILRYEILYRYGGLYLDTDFECLMYFGHYLAANDYILVLENSSQLANCIIGAVPGSDFLRTVCNSLGARRNRSHIVERTGPRFLTDVARLYFRNLPLLPTELFFPFEWNSQKPRELEGLRELYPTAVAVHHFNSRWK